MANEIYYSGLGDVRASEILHQELNLLLADRFSIRNHPSVLRYSNAAGSTVLSIPFGGLDGSDLMAAVAENAATSNTAFTDASATLTIGRQALQYQMTDLANLTDSVGVNVDRLAVSMVGSAEMRATEMLANVLDDFTTVVGTTTVDMSVDDFFDAQFALTVANVTGPVTSILHPRQLTDLQNSLRAEAGAIQFIAATQDMLSAKGVGFAGQLNGVDIFSSSHVPTANTGADRAGSMFGRGAVGLVEGTVRPVAGSAMLFPAGTIVMVEYERDAAGAQTKIVGNYFAGTAIMQDGLGVSIITDA